MPVELQVAIICFAGLAIGYVGIFARMDPPTIGRVLCGDVAVFTMCLTTIGALFWGTGTTFSTGFGTVNWFWFTVVCYSVLECPFFFWLHPKLRD